MALLLALFLTVIFFLFISDGMADLLGDLVPLSLPFVESLKFGGFTLSLIVGVTGIVVAA